MTAQVALVMALLLLRIHTSERNMGWKNGGGGGSRGAGRHGIRNLRYYINC